MKKFILSTAVLALLGITVSVGVFAQPPRGDRPPGEDRHAGQDGPPGPGQDGPPRMPNPVMTALDADGDHEISAEEIANAATALLALDKNGDGKLTSDETRPPRPEGRPGGGPEGRGPEGRPDGPPPERGEGPPEGRGPEGGPPGQGRDRNPGGPGQGPGRGVMGPPNSENMVEHAMQFDADGDGKLDKAELLKFATEMSNHQGPPGAGGPGGRGREGGRGPGNRGGNGQEGERPRRPSVE